jgi:hypothetical protein
MVLRWSKIFIVTDIQIALSSVGAESSGFINDRRWVAGRFSWQEGGFSYSHSQLNTVIRYIENQQNHHRRKSFDEEYLELLKRFNVPHDQRYIFNLWIQIRCRSYGAGRMV